MDAKRQATDKRLAIVTGTSSGIGAAIAAALLRAGWTVVGLARRSADFGNERYSHSCIDLGETAGLSEFAKTHLAPAVAGSPWQQVALVNNAARLGALCRVEAMEPRVLAEVMAVNVVAPVFLMGFMARTVPLATPLRLVNISSGAARMGVPGLADYCASKAALHLAGMSLAAEFGQQSRDAAVFSYEPGVVETEMQVAARATDPADFPSHQTFQDFAAQGVLVQPEAVVGNILAFLNSASDKTFIERRFGAT